MARSPLLKRKTPEEVEKEKAAIIAQGAIDVEEPEQTDLLQYFSSCWEAARKAKEPIKERLLANKRQIEGIYDPQKLSAIKSINSAETFILLTDTKCRNAEAWVREILFQPGSKPWDIEPTPIAELPEETSNSVLEMVLDEIMDLTDQQNQDNAMAMQPPADPSQIFMSIMQHLPDIEDSVRYMMQEQAKETAAKMFKNVDDVLVEGGWYQALRDVVPDVILLTGIVKGPVPKRRVKIKPSINPKTNKFEVKTVTEVIDTYEYRSPFCIYPSPDSTTINDGYLFDLAKITPQALQELIGVSGFEEKEIKAVLDEYINGTLTTNWTMETVVDDARALSEEGKEQRAYVSSFDSDKIDCLQFWGAVDGKKLKEWSPGLKYKRKAIDDTKLYNISAWYIDTHIIKLAFNEDPLGNKPYSKASFEERNGSFWGKGLPEVIADTQQVCNACARAIVNNVGFACLTGDTVVYREGQDKKYASVTMQELWDKKSQHNSGLRRIKLRSLNTDTGEFFGNRIVDVYDNGVADIYEMTTERGYKIRATGTHRFMNDVGEWQVLDDFDVGVLIAIDGDKVSYDTIASIEYVGQERVFNLQMTAPYHNFIANGFVSKNSGPMVERNIDRIPPHELADNVIIPWRVWDVTDEQMMGGGHALQFYSPPMNAEKMLRVFDRFLKIADEQSGVPAYAHGDTNVGGGGRTASGLSMLMAGAARGIRSLVNNIDTTIIIPTVERQYYRCIQKQENVNYICDYIIVAKGSSSLMAKEQQAVRRIELLNNTNNPADLQIIGIEGRKELLRQALKSMDIDITKILPEQSKLEAQAQQQIPMMPGGPGGEMDMGAMGPGAGNFGSQQPAPMNVDVSGAPARGQDATLFNRGGGGGGM